MASQDNPGQDDELSLPEDSEETTAMGGVEAVSPPPAETAADAEAGEGEEETPKLQLEVEIESRSTCERHVTVRVSRQDIDRYFDKEFSELVGKAQVPGFRAGHAPRKLVEARFRKEIKEGVKANLIRDSIEQASKDRDLSAISEPDFEFDAVVIPDEGPMTFEFDLEVRPEFDVPNWKGLTIERPTRDISDQDVELELKNLLANHGTLVPYDGAAEPGDYVGTKLTFTFDGKELAKAEDEMIRIRPVLSFRDGKIEKFDELMRGAQAGDTRVGEAILSEDAPNAELRGKAITATFEIKEIKRLQLPELTTELLSEIGNFESEADLRDAIRDSLHRQLEFRQRQRAREQVVGALVGGANWDLPPRLLERQSRRELSRAVMELRSAGFSDDQILAHENALRRNSRVATARGLKQHFILEKIAEQENIEVEEDDLEMEIRRIARQADQTPRRVRAQIEKDGQMDVLRNQVIEGKVIDLVLSQAKFQDVPYQPESLDEEALDRSVAGEEEPPIPEAKPET